MSSIDLNEMLVFARVVQAGSFTKAAAQLGMPKSTVSRKVFELEERLKTRLLQRTTRKLGLTDIGRTYYDYCARIVAEAEGAERAVSGLQDVRRGLLRVRGLVSLFSRRFCASRIYVPADWSESLGARSKLSIP